MLVWRGKKWTTQCTLARLIHNITHTIQYSVIGIDSNENKDQALVLSFVLNYVLLSMSHPLAIYFHQEVIQVIAAQLSSHHDL